MKVSLATLSLVLLPCLFQSGKNRVGSKDLRPFGFSGSNSISFTIVVDQTLNCFGFGILFIVKILGRVEKSESNQ